MPDIALLELEITLRSRGRSVSQIKKTLMSLKKIFFDYDIHEVSVLGTDTILLHLDLMEEHKLSYFDSLIAVSAINIDGTIVSDDKVFDYIEGLKRIPITGKWS